MNNNIDDELDIIFKNELKHAIELSLKEEKIQKEKNLPQIPNIMKIPSKLWNLETKSKFYDYCQNIYVKFSEFLFLSIMDARYNNNYSERKDIFNFPILSHGAMRSQMKTLSDINNEYTNEIMRKFCTKFNITITPMTQILIKNSIKLCSNLMITFDGINSLWLHLFSFLFTQEQLTEFKKLNI